MRQVVLLSMALLAASPRVARADPRTPPVKVRAEELARARALDQQGAKAYGDGRYNDAIRYFEEALRLGGPPFELWNLAKCHLKLDQPEQAAEMLERYLASPALPAEDRDEATEQLAALRLRPSTVTLASSPSGATVTLDGRSPEGVVARTPTTFTVQPGVHTITLALPRHAPYTEQLEVRYGRAVILDVPLGPLGKEPRPASPASPSHVDESRPFAVRADLGIMVPRYGSLGGAAHAALTASATYHVTDVSGAALSAGVLLHVTGDSWDNAVGAATALPPCGTLQSPQSATALSMFAIGAAGWEIAARLRAHALAGVGVAAYFANDLGGDVFVPACGPSPAPRPALLFGGQLDYALTPSVRLSALPLLLQLQPSFEGSRTTPIDTSGVWLRATIAIGVGLDL